MVHDELQKYRETPPRRGVASRPGVDESRSRIRDGTTGRLVSGPAPRGTAIPEGMKRLLLQDA